MNSIKSHILLNNININNIQIYSNNDNYRINYRYNNSILFNIILFEISNFNVLESEDNIKLYSENFGTIHDLNNFFINNNFKNIIHNDSSNKKYILLNNNKYTKHLEKYSTLYIYIKYVKKYNNIPIIHLLYGK